MGKLVLESVMRTSPPDEMMVGFWASILCVNFLVDCLNPFGFSDAIEPGLLPWKMYFSDLGIDSNSFGGMRKFSLRTDFGVCAIHVYVS